MEKIKKDVSPIAQKCEKGNVPNRQGDEKG